MRKISPSSKVMIWFIFPFIREMNQLYKSTLANLK
jgi:hypothetical protein